MKTTFEKKMQEEQPKPSQRIISEYYFEGKYSGGDQTFCLLNKCEEYGCCDYDPEEPCRSDGCRCVNHVP